MAEKLDPLRSWPELNKKLLSTEDVEETRKLLADELAGRGRIAFALRIHCRLNKIRAAQERAAIEAKLGGPKGYPRARHEVPKK